MHTRINAKHKLPVILCKWQNILVWEDLTVTLRGFHTPYHTRWQYIAKHIVIMHIRHAMANLAYCGESLYYRYLNQVMKIFNFRLISGWRIFENFIFGLQVRFSSTKRRKMQMSFMPKKSKFELFDKKLPARRVIVKSRYFRYVVITTVKIGRDIGIVIV